MPKFAERNWTAISKRLEKEELLTISQAARLVPTGRGGRGHSSSSALFRWIMHGKGGIYLDGLKMGAGWVTSRAALARFGAAVAAGQMPADEPSVTDIQRRVAAATATWKKR